MKLHLITVGHPKLDYAQKGWEVYWQRLARYHQARATHIPDRHNDTEHLLAATKGTYTIALVIDGQELTSQELAHFLDKRATAGQEASFLIGGPDGLPTTVIEQADYRWSLGKLTLPHDLAMVVVLEALYRATAINAGHPYHRG